MAAFTILLSADRTTVTLSAVGHFDLSHGFALWQYCEPDRNRHESYIIDLADVTDMRDSGLGWLMMFCHWARRSGAGVRVVHARAAIAYRLLAAGIAHEPGCYQSAEGEKQQRPWDAVPAIHAQNRPG
ncbi:MAG: STAS domain-containing protein [Gammaproteobacteria bacterium]